MLKITTFHELLAYLDAAMRSHDHVHDVRVLLGTPGYGFNDLDDGVEDPRDL